MELSLGGWKARHSHAPQMAQEACAPGPIADSRAPEHVRLLETITLRIASCDDLEKALPPLLSELLSVMRCGLQGHDSTADGLALINRDERSRRRESGSREVPPELCVMHRSPEHKKDRVIVPSGLMISDSTRQRLASALEEMASRDTVSSGNPPALLMALTAEQESSVSWLWLDAGLATSTLKSAAIAALSRGLTLHHRRQAQQTVAIQAAVAEAVQAERRSLAAELHDTLAQELSYLQMQTSRLTRAARHAPLEVQTLAEDVHTQTRRTFRQTRELINGAHAVWSDAPLACVLENLIEEFETRSNMVFELDNRIQSLHLSDADSLQVMFIVREALTNSVRHAHATHLHLQLLYPQADQVAIAIEDNGSGFDPGEIAPAHFGLGIMQDRARSIGAQFSITQRHHGGTRVALQWERNAR